MRNLSSLALTAGFALAATISLSSAANAVAFVNGGFETGPAPGSGCSFGPVAGWNTANDRCGTGFFGAAPPEGVVFAIIGNGRDFPGGSLSQTLTGLTIGTAYTVSFKLGGEEWAIPHAIEQVQVSMLSGSATAAQIFSAPVSSNASPFSGGPLWDNWAGFTYDFTANATSADIQFQQTTATQASGDTGLDDVSIALAGPHGVPEPMMLALFGAGLAGLGAMRRRRKAGKST